MPGKHVLPGRQHAVRLRCGHDLAIRIHFVDAVRAVYLRHVLERRQLRDLPARLLLEQCSACVLAVPSGHLQCGQGHYMLGMRHWKDRVSYGPGELHSLCRWLLRSVYQQLLAVRPWQILARGRQRHSFVPAVFAGLHIWNRCFVVHFLWAGHLLGLEPNVVRRLRRRQILGEHGKLCMHRLLGWHVL